MPLQNFYKTLVAELDRIDATKVDKRHERVIEGFTSHENPRALIGGREVMIFNSNDYLGLRHHSHVTKAEHEASKRYGTGPGAVRFISGSLQVHRDLERELAVFHGRDDGMIFSSAFAANMGVLFSLITGQSRDSVVSGNTLVISDELNHRSIIDGIRLAHLPKNNRIIFPHLQPEKVGALLEENAGTFDRVIVVTDGVFSMLGEVQNLSALRAVVDKYQEAYKEGVLLVVDDCHGVAAIGKTGRGTEEVTGGQAHVLVGTLGKGFGADGGYVVADQPVIDYLREAAATYIYSNNISPATAGAALASVQIVGSNEGVALLKNVRSHISVFKEKMIAAGFTFAADSNHPIQAILVADPVKTKALTDKLFQAGCMVTNINYPVVAKGKDEIRVQLSATHTAEDIDFFVEIATKVAKEVGVL